MLLLTFLIFFISLTLLIKGSDLFVDEAARVARLLGISEFVIGLTIVALGTSFPELASAVYAAVINRTTLAIGTIVGSNIANIGFVLAIGAVLTPIIFKPGSFQKDAGILLGASLLFFILALDGTISLVDGILFLCLFFAYLFHVLHDKQQSEDKLYTTFFRSYVHAKHHTLTLKNYKDALCKGFTYKICQRLLKEGIDVRQELKHHLLHDIFKKLFFCIIGTLGLSLGAKYLVSSSITLATTLDISPAVIALSAVAVGTSLPELFVTLTSARKGLGSILLGNIVGSNIANILFVGGVAALIQPLAITKLDFFLTFPAMLFMTLSLLHFIRSKWMSKIFQGFLFLLFYSIFLFFLVLFRGLAV